MYYIYLVIIWHPKFTVYYVGKHHWEGYGLDPLYEGSCTYRYYKQWLRSYKHAVHILQISTKESVDADERRWILKCLRKHGSFLHGSYTNDGHVYRWWLDEFGKGFCLNGHWGSCECQPLGVQAARDPEIRKDVARKVTIFNKSAQGQLNVRKRVEASVTAEARMRNAASHRNQWKHKYSLYRQGKFVMSGTSGEIAEYLGISYSYASQWCTHGIKPKKLTQYSISHE